MSRDQAFLAVESKGRWGKAFEIPGTASLNADGDGDVAAVSCPSAGACAATGTYEASSGAVEVFVVWENKGHWAKATEVRGFGSLNAGDYGEVTAISCAAAGYCTLGGSYLDSSDHRQAFLATEAKGRWGRAQRLPGMSGLNHGGNAGLNALPCASAGNCVAGGSYRPSTSSTHTQAYLAVQKIGHWGNAAEVPGTASLNAGGGAQVTAASCPAVARASPAASTRTAQDACGCSWSASTLATGHGREDAWPAGSQRPSCGRAFPGAATTGG